jgi:hypothetical protein
MKQAVTVLLGVCCLLLVFATPSHATNLQNTLSWMSNVASLPGACTTAQAAQSKSSLIFAASCSLQVECADSSVISCGGASTCNTSPDGRCVICDGVTAGCCPQTCCETCENSLSNCLDNCDFKCNLCWNGYNHCVNNCTGGC